VFVWDGGKEEMTEERRDSGIKSEGDLKRGEIDRLKCWR
jgi:hypothetical protein